MGEKNGREVSGEGGNNNIYKHLHLIRVPFLCYGNGSSLFVVVVVVVMYPKRILPKEDLKGFRFLFWLSRFFCPFVAVVCICVQCFGLGKG